MSHEPEPWSMAGLLCLAFSLSSCQLMTQVGDTFRTGFANYRELSEDQPHAVLRVSSDGNVAAFPRSACHSPDVADSGLVLTREMIQVGASGLNGQKRGLPGQPIERLPYAEFRVPAGAVLAIGYGTGWRDGDRSFGCSKYVRFTPAAGQAYEFVGVGDIRSGTCSVMVSTLAEPREPVALQGAPRCKTP